MSLAADQYRALRSGAAPAAKRLLLRMGIYGALRQLRPSHDVAILRYHAICGPEGYRYASPGICVSPAAFEQQVRYLAAHYHVMSLPDAVAALREGHPLPPNAVAITFDDGYADNLAAAQTLSRYGLTGTFYLTAGCLSGEQPFWPSELRALVAQVSDAVLGVEVDGEMLRMPCRTSAERERAVRRLTTIFKSRSIPERERLRNTLRRTVGVGRVRSPMLTWKQAAELARLGMTIGAHTMTHPNLPSAGLADATTEIVTSKQRLEGELGVPVTMFSYPNGGAERYYTAELEKVVESAGFAAATTSRAGFASSSSDFYALERVEVSERLEELVYNVDVERIMLAGHR
jgi:peptidoglycan/xylan/chitin deacetylase (PgdA/CDA1 family)